MITRCFIVDGGDCRYCSMCTGGGVVENIVVGMTLRGWCIIMDGW